MKRKIISLIVVFVVVMSSVMIMPIESAAGTSDVRLRYGDVDEDGVMTSNDALTILLFAAKLKTLTEEQQQAADVDFDGKIDAADALIVLKYAARLISTVYTRMPSTALYKSTNTDSDSILIPYMTRLILEETYPGSTGVWSKVLYHGEIYYFWQAKDEADKMTDTPSSFSWTGLNRYQDEVIDLAKEILTWKTGYSHGQSTGTPDTDGVCKFDCSGLAAYVLDTVMQRHVPTYDLYAETVALYNTAVIYNKGYSNEYSAATLFTLKTDENRLELSNRELDQLQTGDVLFFDLPEETDETNDKNVGYTHCGIYLGNGEFIHATRSWGGTENHPGYGSVCIMPLYGFYAQNCVGARRYLPDPEEVAPINQTMYTVDYVNNIYDAKSAGNNPCAVLGAEEQVTLLYTDAGNWAYVSYTLNGKTQEGFIQANHLSADAPKSENRPMYLAKISQVFHTENSADSEGITLYYGDEVVYLRHYSTTSSWYLVSIQGQEYYLWAKDGIDAVLTDDYDTLMDPTDKPVKIVNKGTNLRSTTDTSGNANIIRMLKNGEKVTVLAESDNGNWSYVMTESGDRGFVSSSYLSEVDR